MAKTARDLLLETLENLGEKQFKRFKGKLNDWEVPDGYRRIPKNQLEKADEDDVADLIIRSYTESYGIEVALGVLAAIGEMDPHEKLHKSWQKVAASTPPVKPGADSQRATPADGQHFVHRHQVALIKRVSHIDPVLDGLLGDGTLTQEEYDTVRSKGTPQERMRQLYAYIKAWGKIEKDKFYQYLLEENGPLVRDLENN